MTGTGAPAGLVHGMGTDLVEPDWPPLTTDEVGVVLAAYDPSSAARSAEPARILWHSPRPMSAAALVEHHGGVVVVKRHDPRVRTVAQLGAEHMFARHLRRHGAGVPAVLRTRRGATATRHEGFVYEVHEQAEGLDLYREAMSWSPFASLGHARAAGTALARLHQAAASFRAPARPQAVLSSSCAVVLAPDPLAQVSRLLAARPGLAAALAQRPWRQDFARDVLPAIERAAPLLGALAPQWSHGDWHPSNLTWTSAGAGAEVAAVFDFGLANRTSAVHDLATALERSTISWLDLAGPGQAEGDLDAIDALLDGYEAVRPLTGAEAAALPAALPVVHVEYALSEVEYFAAVVGSAENTDLAYGGYLLGHCRWFAGAAGQAVLDRLRARTLGARR
jgi:Ser/Thr protein kinase RdoA (MazF antagonist)